MIIPAQDPNAGRPEAMSLRSGSSMSKATESRHRVVDSPPGMTSPSIRWSSSGRRTGDGLAADRLERAQVLGHVALKGEHADDRLHRSSSR